MGFYDNINGFIKTYPIHNAQTLIETLDAFVKRDILYAPGDVIRFPSELGMDVIHKYYEKLRIINQADLAKDVYWCDINAYFILKRTILNIIVNSEDYIEKHLCPEECPPVMNIVKCDEYNPMLNKTNQTKCIACNCAFRNMTDIGNYAYATSPICRTLNCQKCKFTSLIRGE